VCVCVCVCVFVGVCVCVYIYIHTYIFQVFIICKNRFLKRVIKSNANLTQRVYEEIGSELHRTFLRAERRVKYETRSPHGRFQARYVINLLKMARLLNFIFNERLLLLLLSSSLQPAAGKNTECPSLSHDSVALQTYRNYTQQHTSNLFTSGPLRIFLG